MLNNQNWEREKLIHKYVTSLDNGDMKGVAEVLEAACSDPELARITEEIDLHYQEEEGVARHTSDADVVRKLAREHLHSAFDPLPNNPLDFSVIRGKTRETVTVGDVALIMKEAERIPSKDRDKVDLLLGLQTLVPKNSGIKDIRKLFESLSLDVTFSDRFLDIFRSICIKTSIKIGLKNSPKPKIINISGNLNKDW